MPRYKLRIAYPSDQERVMSFMVETYMKSEPTIVNIGGSASSSPGLIQLLEKNVREGLTIIVEEGPRNRLVGAAVNVDSRREDVERIAKIGECCECACTRDLMGFYVFCTRQADPWSLYCLDNVFECAHVAVHPNHQGEGLARRLVQESWVIARDIAYRLFRIDCSSRYTAKIAEDFSWKCIYSIPFRRYFSNGDFVFKCIQEPHTELKIFVDRLNYYNGYYPPSKCQKSNRRRKC